ncbi:MAG TPA: nuclear transport factor 2 family protein [Caulobacterales bacterium]|nr:nuclear transport factor 2 family protein [Caulobacterales bacterium]
MTHALSRRLALGIGLAASLAAGPALARGDDDIQLTVRRFLDAYAGKDIETLMGMLDSEAILVIGADAAEVVNTPDGARALLEADYRLFERSAFRDFRSFNVRREGRGASVFFEVPWSRLNPGEPDFLLRFAQFWVRRGRDWKLAQSLNAVATQGQSARELAG